MASFAHSESVNFGFTGPLSGSSTVIGQELVQGIELGFQHINNKGGLPYTLNLIAKDDGYEPARTISAIENLITEHDVIGLVGSVGTPTIISAMPLITKQKLPLVFPFSGSSLFNGENIRPLIFTHRTNYESEAHLLVKTLVEEFHLKPNEMAIYLQQDSYGDSTLRNLVAALKEYGLQDANDLLQIRYERNHSNANQAAVRIIAQPEEPKAIILISTYPAAQELIQVLNDLHVSPIFASFSFVGHEFLRQDLEGTHAKLLSTQVHPCLTHNNDPFIKEYLADRVTYGLTDGSNSIELEGYIAARYVASVLQTQHAKAKPTRESFLKALQQYEADDSITKHRSLSSVDHTLWLEWNNFQTHESLCGVDFQHLDTGGNT